MSYFSHMFYMRDINVTYCHAFSDRRRGIGLPTGFIGLQCTITVTEYHNVLPLQHSSRTEHKAGNGSSACVPIQHSSGIPCHQFTTGSVSILDHSLTSWLWGL
jgi:hypothetical protein